MAGSRTIETKALMVACLEIKWNDHRWGSADSVASQRKTYLLVLELNEGIVVLDDLIAEILRLGEQLG